MIRVYLSGPITGLSEEEYTRRFATAERHYEAAGYEVVNPVTIGQELRRGNPEVTYADYMAADPAETRLHLAMAKLRLAQLDLGEKIGDVIDYGAGRRSKEANRKRSAEYAEKNKKKVREQAKSYYERIKEEGGERWKRLQERHKKAAREWARRNK